MNKPKVKGTRGESELVKYGVAHGFPDMRRVALHGGSDQGDVGWITAHGLVGGAEAKNYKGRPSPGQIERWQAETLRERDAGGWDFMMLVVHEPGCNMEDHRSPTFGRNRVYMTLGDLHAMAGIESAIRDVFADEWVQLTVEQAFRMAKA